jgi:hypothetical protein
MTNGVEGDDEWGGRSEDEWVRARDDKRGKAGMKGYDPIKKIPA